MIAIHTYHHIKIINDIFAVGWCSTKVVRCCCVLCVGKVGRKRPTAKPAPFFRETIGNPNHRISRAVKS